MALTCLIVGFFAVVRGTKILVDDRIAAPYRQWIVSKWGKDSLIAYWAHCPWCTSIWVGALVMPPVVLWPNQWTLAAVAVLASSLFAGLILDKE